MRLCSMRMPVVQIGIVRMAMNQPRMGMDMRMRLVARRRAVVMMVMMRIMHMAMLMLERVMGVIVLVALGEMEIKPDCHQRAGCDQHHRQRLAEERDGDDGADEGRDRVIGCGPRGAERAQRRNV